MKNLFSILIWDFEAGEYEGSAYAIIAKDMEEAGQLAKKIHHEDTGSPVESLLVDSELSFEITCAPDRDGLLYDIHFSKQ